MNSLRARPVRRFLPVLTTALAAACALPAFSVRADVKEVRLGVKGATCATCAFALRKGFKRIESVADATLKTKPAFMYVHLKPGLWPDTDRMQEMIKDTGFQPVPDQVELTATGTLVKGDKAIFLFLDGMKSPTTVTVVPTPPTGKTLELDPFFGHPVEVEGKWKQATSGGTLLLSAVRFQK